MLRRTESSHRSWILWPGGCAWSADVPGQCVRNAKPTAQSGCAFWRCRIDLDLKPARVCATISKKNYLDIYQVGTLLWFLKTGPVFFVMLEHLTLSQWVKVCSPCLQRQLSFMPRKHPAAEHWLLQEGDLNLWAKRTLTGTGSISININENVRSWFRAWSDLWGFSAKWCTYISFSFGHCWKAVQNDVN